METHNHDFWSRDSFVDSVTSAFIGGKLHVEATKYGGAIVWLRSHTDTVIASWILAPGNTLKVEPIGIRGELTQT